MDYLGHVITPGKLHVVKTNTDAVDGFRPPRTQTELKSFLGLCNVYRRFVPKSARTAGPLQLLLRKGQPFEIASINEAQLQAFSLLKEALAKPPVLCLPRSDLPFSIDTDACEYQVGCALLQTYPDGQRHSPTILDWQGIQADPECIKRCEGPSTGLRWHWTSLIPYDNVLNAPKND